MSDSGRVFLGIRGTVLALDAATGSEIWRTALKGSEFVNVVLQGGRILATAKGEIFCLDPSTGKVLWGNPLKGLGTGLVTIGGASGIPPMEADRRKQQAAAAGAAASAG